MHYFDLDNLQEPVALVSSTYCRHRGRYYVPTRWIKDIRGAPPRTVFKCFHSNKLSENPEWTNYKHSNNTNHVSDVFIYKIIPTPKSETLDVDEPIEEMDISISLQNKLKQAITEGIVTSSTSSEAQITSLKNIVKILTNHYSSPSETNDTNTTLDLKILKQLVKLIEKCLVFNNENDNDVEKSSTIAQLIILLMTFQPDNQEDIMAPLFSKLQSQALNNENPLNLRTTSVIYLALIKSFSQCDDIVELETLLTKFESIFFNSLNIKKDKVKNTEIDDFQCGIFTAWISIAILLPLDNLFYRFAQHGSLMDILNLDGANTSDSNDIDDIIETLSFNVRFKIAEVIGILLEYAQTENEDFLEEFLKIIFQKLLSNKMQCYKMRQIKTKRQNFSDIENFIIHNKLPKKSLSFGRDASDTESINIGSFITCNKYKLLCNIFGNQLQIHLEQTQFVRDIFELGNVKIEPLLGYPLISSKDKRVRNLYVSKRHTVIRKNDRESKYYRNANLIDEE